MPAALSAAEIPHYCEFVSNFDGWQLPSTGAVSREGGVHTSLLAEHALGNGVAIEPVRGEVEQASDRFPLSSPAPERRGRPRGVASTTGSVGFLDGQIDELVGVHVGDSDAIPFSASRERPVGWNVGGRVPGSPLIEDGADGGEGQRMATAGENGARWAGQDTEVWAAACRISENVTGTTPRRAICPLREEGVAGMDGGCRGRLPAGAICLNGKEQQGRHPSKKRAIDVRTPLFRT